jgi:hypothetical protein
MVQWRGNLNNSPLLPEEMLSSSFLEPEDAGTGFFIPLYDKPRQERRITEETAKNPLSGHVREKSLDNWESMQHYCAKNL